MLSLHLVGKLHKVAHILYNGYTSKTAYENVVLCQLNKFWNLWWIFSLTVAVEMC